MSRGSLCVVPNEIRIQWKNNRRFYLSSRVVFVVVLVDWKCRLTSSSTSLAFQRSGWIIRIVPVQLNFFSMVHTSFHGLSVINLCYFSGRLSPLVISLDASFFILVIRRYLKMAKPFVVVCLWFGHNLGLVNFRSTVLPVWKLGNWERNWLVMMMSLFDCIWRKTRVHWTSGRTSFNWRWRSVWLVKHSIKN